MGIAFHLFFKSYSSSFSIPVGLTLESLRHWAILTVFCYLSSIPIDVCGQQWKSPILASVFSITNSFKIHWIILNLYPRKRNPVTTHSLSSTPRQSSSYWFPICSIKSCFTVEKGPLAFISMKSIGTKILFMLDYVFLNPSALLNILISLLSLS